MKILSLYQNGVHKSYLNMVSLRDSPELAHGLDSNSFADLELSIALHDITANNDPQKFQLGTPAEI